MKNENISREYFAEIGKTAREVAEMRREEAEREAARAMAEDTGGFNIARECARAALVTSAALYGTPMPTHAQLKHLAPDKP